MYFSLHVHAQLLKNKMTMTVYRIGARINCIPVWVRHSDVCCRSKPVTDYVLVAHRLKLHGENRGTAKRVRLSLLSVKLRLNIHHGIN